jgi:hypothetical protein
MRIRSLIALLLVILLALTLTAHLQHAYAADAVGSPVDSLGDEVDRHQMAKGVLLVRSRDYKPPQPEPLVTPPVTPPPQHSSQSTSTAAPKPAAETAQKPHDDADFVLREPAPLKPVHATRPEPDLVSNEIPVPSTDDKSFAAALPNENAPLHHHADPLVDTLKTEIKVSASTS